MHIPNFWTFSWETKKTLFREFSATSFRCLFPGQARSIYRTIIKNESAGSNSAACLQESKNDHGPPRVDQHDEGKHPKRQAIFITRLLITHTPVLDESLDFILGSLHISKVIHSLISFDSYDEDPGRMSLLQIKLIQRGIDY